MPTDAPATSHPTALTRAARMAQLDRSRLYVCTGSRSDTGDLAEFAESALAGGVDLIQVRDKELEARAEIDALLQVRPIVRRHDALLAVNDRADVAVLVGADVLHVGQGDLSTEQARAIVGNDMLLGRSTHSKDQVQQAISDPGLDYFCVGPVWETPTKPGRAAVGLELVRYAAEWANKPWFAIGGIDREERLRAVVQTGATRVVVVRAIQQQPRERAAALRAQLPA